MWVIVWIVLCFVVAWAAGQKGRSGVGYFFLSLLLSPIIGFLVLIVVPSKAPVTTVAQTPPASSSGYIVCQSCGRPNSDVFRTCTYCSASLRPRPPLPQGYGFCPDCMKPRPLDSKQCLRCDSLQPMASG